MSTSDKKRHSWTPARFICLQCGTWKVGVRLPKVGTNPLPTFRTQYIAPTGEITTKAPVCDPSVGATVPQPGKTRCRFEVSPLRATAPGEPAETAFHSGRPLYSVTCKVHGVIHPKTTNPTYNINTHLDDETYVWFPPTKEPPPCT